MNRRNINSIAGGKVLRTVITLIAVLLTGGSATAGVVVKGNVYGGGNLADVGGSVTVNMSAGTVEKDVYGGGALANTNVNNWDATKNEGTGGWADGMYNESTGKTTNTTTVSLTGGTIKGDAYGGGLGQKTGFNSATSDIEATVWGDIAVNLGSSTSGSSATAFYITNYTGDHADVVKSGRVFGCNNLLGSPQGNVTVTVYKTVAGNVTRTASDKLKLTTTDAGYVTPTYEVAAVYGGGNLADYTTTGKMPYVRIETCDVSIRDVYGGGNAAEVPGTDVLVRGAYEIQEVFGGGNGNDPYTKDGGTTWVDNPGANIGNTTTPGNATTLLTGGYVHEAYGGSNKRGTVFGNVSIDMGAGSVSENTNGACTLDVEKLVGAGKDADVNGDLIMVMGCKPDVKTPVLYAGADNANVNGDVELTITSGNFGKVFGGNNAGGIIMGHIILNIEETGECDVPIEIDELYLGGNEAMYSQYGYYKDGNTYKPRTAEMAAITDPNATGYTPAVTTAQYGTEVRKTAPYDAPKLNIVSCTYIGQVFGGGYGTKATLYGDPIVNINMIKGSFADNTTNGVPAKMTALSLPSTENTNHLGIIGTVYGGGNAADVNGNTTVNIGTASTVDLVSTGAKNQTVLGAYITGNVYGGGKGEAKTTAGTAGEAFLCAKAMVNGDTGTQVNIGNGYVGGNVYGGGEVGRVDNNTVVTIGLATADIPTGGTSAPIINGNVFGAGKGVNTHGYSALVRGTSTVTVQADAKVRGSVYGGGEIASVGKYKVVDGLPQVLDNSQNSKSGYCYVTITDNAEIGPDDMIMTKSGGPDDAGHVFGAGKGVLPFEGYADDVQPFHMNGSKNPDDSWTDVPTSYYAFETYDANTVLQDTYAKFIKSLALATATEVTISGNAFIKGSVYGGSENGYVQKDTKVMIKGGQIGNGYVQMDDNGNYLTTPLAVNRRYTEPEWTQKKLILGNDDRAELKTLVGDSYYTSSLPECASWPYGQATAVADRYAPYDPYATASGNYANGKTAEGGRPMGDDGHTFYGNVFGGGSGYYPYKPGRWFEDAGAVYGNTVVDITGGYILTNVYGANEMTDVGQYALDSNGKPTTIVTSGGKCTINFGGTATIGVPRTVKQINAHPLTCYLFGAGKGDQRVFFNRSTNVGDVEVNITGGTIYGSVYGGGEDGHVMRDVKLTIENTPTIGTSGMSGEDGNVFGGGRGFAANAYTAGNVAGSVKMEIKGGKILGSVYGGGQLASVGYGLFDSTNTANYGVMQEDTKDDTEETSSYYKEGAVKLGRGHVDITISGGTIGNDDEYTYDANNPLSHTKGGNVFAGGMGRFFQLDGTSFIRDVDWRKLGCVKSTKLKITGGTIMSNVYGGGELGQVVGYQKDATNEDDKLSTDISIEGDDTQIGSEIKDGGVTQYTFGSVYGSGYGSLLEEITLGDGTTKTNPKFEAGLVKYDTKVDMQGGKVLASIYGGGEVASVGFSTDIAGQTFTVEGNDKDGKTITTTVQKTNVVGSTHVSVRGSSQVGIAPITLAGGSKRYFGGAKMGNVYGGGSGHANAVRTGKVFKNANVSISGSPTIYHNIYGGGAYGTVGDFGYVEGNENVDVNGETVTVKKVFGVAGVRDATSGVATVTITGGTIGVDGHENGMVFGSSRGDINAPWERDDHTAWVNTANVTIGTAATGTQGQEGYVAASGPHIKGSVYGSGENGHTFNNTVVTVNGGTIGIESGAPVTSNGVEYSGAAYPYRGNVYGGGCGTDMYDSNSDGTEDSYNPLAGIVYGNTTVNINGGTVVRDVYGAGAMGSVGKTVTIDGVTTVTGGSTQVNISGGTIGIDGNDNGNVFGSARGSEGISTNLANVITSEVNIKPGANVWGSVYGGGEAGFVKGNVAVNMLGGSVKHDLYGGGALAHTNISNWDATNSTWATGMYNATTHATTYHTNVSLKGGTVTGNVYGGGLGRMEATGVEAVEAKVYGDVTLELNKPVTTTTGEGESATTTTTYGDCVVKGNIFGCNNLNGSPQNDVTVHVYKTAGWTETKQVTDKEGEHTVTVSHTKSANKDNTTYDLAAVYGGGNLASFYPDNATSKALATANVIIDGCNLTSIGTVYGGGNAASVPATEVTVNGTYEIGEVFGGGNGYDKITINGVTQDNPGANVGYLAYTSDSEKAAAAYGTGKAHATIFGGTVHAVYGGSNTKGNVRVQARATLEDAEDCSFDCGEAYGGGRKAEMDGDAVLEVGCISGLGKAYGGAANADVNGNVTLHITNGTYGQVFGGNDAGGAIRGSITVNIEETGCRPIIIGELYGGGNEAPYSVYGYETDADGKAQPLTSLPEGGTKSPDPQVNVKSFTSIGKVFGGGYGPTATMVANPQVNINVYEGKYYNNDDKDNNGKKTSKNSVIGENARVVGSAVAYSATDATGYDSGFPIPSHAKGKIGAINTVFGGGNAAKVIGNPTVNIGTEAGEEVYAVVDVATGADVKGLYTRTGAGTTESPYTYTEITTTTTAASGTTYYLKTTKAVDIRGNVYGGGNEAEVTGNTSVQIGKKVGE